MVGEGIVKRITTTCVLDVSTDGALSLSIEGLTVYVGHLNQQQERAIRTAAERGEQRTNSHVGAKRQKGCASCNA